VEPALPVFVFTVTALPPEAAGDEVDDDPLVPALTEINGDEELGSTPTPVFALPLVPELRLLVPIAVDP
jgi:hypothetical protein